MSKIYYIVRADIDEVMRVIGEVKDHVLIGDGAKEGYEFLPYGDECDSDDCIVDYELYTQDDCDDNDTVKVAIEQYKLGLFLNKI